MENRFLKPTISPAINPYLCGANTCPYNIPPAEPTYHLKAFLKGLFSPNALIISDNLDKE
jgi:hypothetical protein